MTSTQDFRRFGHPDRFALDVRLLPDPDGDEAAPRDSVGSWGQWRLWLRGFNLAEHRLEVASGEVVRQEWVTWYLAPLLRWIAEVWTPLLHEERLPTPVRRPDARSAYLSVATTRMDDEAIFGPWQAWAGRHAIRSASEGGLYPDVFLRRVGDDIEASWGDRTQPGGEAVEYVLEPGVAHADVADVAQALDDLLTAMARQAAFREHRWHTIFRRRVAARSSSAAIASRLPWYLDGRPRAGRLSKLFASHLLVLGKQGRSFGRYTTAAQAITLLSPAIAMFGALSPSISDAASARLLAIVASAHADDDAKTPIDAYVAPDSPAWRASEAWDDGYRVALELLDRLDLLNDPGPLDLDGLLNTWEVRRLDEALGEEGPLGVALAGPGFMPTIVINGDHALNQHEHGRRFTLAHELCHLLYDRDRARTVGHSSTPWAPAPVEQRANAFAAMLLMPPAAIKAHLRRGKRMSLSDVIEMARALKIGVQAAIRHLGNMSEVDFDSCERLLLEAGQQGGGHAQAPRMRSDSREPTSA